MERVLFLVDNRLLFYNYIVNKIVNNKLFLIQNCFLSAIWVLSLLRVKNYVLERFSTHARCVSDPDLLRTSRFSIREAAQNKSYFFSGQSIKAFRPPPLSLVDKRFFFRLKIAWDGFWNFFSPQFLD